MKVCATFVACECSCARSKDSRDGVWEEPRSLQKNRADPEGNPMDVSMLDAAGKAFVLMFNPWTMLMLCCGVETRECSNRNAETS